MKLKVNNSHTTQPPPLPPSFMLLLFWISTTRVTLDTYKSLIGLLFCCQSKIYNCFIIKRVFYLKKINKTITRETETNKTWPLCLASGWSVSLSVCRFGIFGGWKGVFYIVLHFRRLQPRDETSPKLLVSFINISLYHE